MHEHGSFLINLDGLRNSEKHPSRCCGFRGRSSSNCLITATQRACDTCASLPVSIAIHRRCGYVPAHICVILFTLTTLFPVLPQALAVLQSVPEDLAVGALQLEAQLRYRLGQSGECIQLYDKLFQNHKVHTHSGFSVI